jgi:hypothetical protein
MLRALHHHYHRLSCSLTHWNMMVW